MKRAHLAELVAARRQWTEPLSRAEKAKGFKGWYSSKYLPHFDAPVSRQFITYRLADAMPAVRRHEWEAFMTLEDDLEKQRRIEAYIDHGYGACHLRDDRIAGTVQENLWHYDGTHYRLLAWVIMPNHVHVLIELWEVPLGEVMQSWKGYTSKQANKVLKRSGAFWAEDYFDHFIRDEAHFWRVVKYIENNPVKAKMVRAPEEWLWSSARFRSRDDLSARTLTHPTAERVESHRGGDGSSPQKPLS